MRLRFSLHGERGTKEAGKQPLTRGSECRGAHISGERRWLHVGKWRRARSWGQEGTPQLAHWLSASGGRRLVQPVQAGHRPRLPTHRQLGRPLLAAPGALMSSGAEELPGLFLHQSAGAVYALPDPSPTQAPWNQALGDIPVSLFQVRLGPAHPGVPLGESAQCPFSAYRSARVEMGLGLLMSPGLLESQEEYVRCPHLRPSLPACGRERLYLSRGALPQWGPWASGWLGAPSSLPPPRTGVDPQSQLWNLS